jgi:hypothetical protein
MKARMRAPLAHDGDDLLDRGRVGRVAQPLVTRWPPGEIAGQGDRRAATASGIQHFDGTDIDDPPLIDAWAAASVGAAL